MNQSTRGALGSAYVRDRGEGPMIDNPNGEGDGHGDGAEMPGPGQSAPRPN